MKLKEITRTEFWKLEDELNSAKMLAITGEELKLTHRGDDKVYWNSQGNWLQSHEGIYFANPKLRKLL